MVKKIKDIEYYEAVGRRKESSARVRLYIVSKKEKTVTVKSNVIKQGQIMINSKLSEVYFPSTVEQNILAKPLVLTGVEDRFAISILVRGGGKSGQLDAIIHGISRALCLIDDTYRPKLKPEGMLTRDPRVRERRKVGTGGKARRQKQSPKR